MPATLAILSIVFIESIYSAAGITDQAASIQHKLLSILVLIAIGVANSISTKVSTRLSSFFVTTKFVTITGIVIAGLLVVIVHLSSTHWDGPATDWYSKSWFGYRDTLAPDGKEIHWSDLAGWEMLGHYSAALYGALWAYSGWDKAGIPSLLRMEIFGLTTWQRLSTLQQSYLHRPPSFHSPLTWQFPSSFFALSQLIRHTTFFFRGA
ncbi:unnamed protein product [Aspergillus oryzae]|nr:unnamed protein product [Aspergillus oryzae]